VAERIESGKPGQARAVLNPEEPDRLLRFEYDRDSNYEAETRITLAMAALIPESELYGADHRMFQVVHLVSEYMWCAMHFELRRVCLALDGNDFGLASRLLSRTTGLADVPAHCLRLLQDFLPQASFLEMRALLLANASGLDSPGSRNLRRVCRALWRSFEDALGRHEISQHDLIEEYSRQGGPAPAERLSALATVQSGMHALDCKVMEWNQLHLRLVRSHLGGHPAAQAGAPAKGGAGPVSLRGEPVTGLERIAEHSLFPRLWQGIDETYERIPRTAMGSDD
jgi:tryptophan 2,3-dioxygenase